MGKTASFSKRVALALKRHGVTELFGQSNPPAVTLDCIALGIRQIGYRQENAGSYMAQGFAMASHRVSVVTAQNGPAATLLVPGLAECLKASHPVVAIVQEVGADGADRNAFQEIDHIKLFEPVAKWVKRIPNHNRIEDYVDMAFVAAASGRPGPAVLLCPADIMNDPAEYPYQDRRTANYGTYPLDRVSADCEKVTIAAKMLAGAKTPLIYAGGGVIASQACEELRAIQEECGIPVATTTMGKGSVDESHPLTLGPIGYYMGKRGCTKFMRSMVEDADVVLLAGNRTNQNSTDTWTLLPWGAKYIHIDIDPIEIGRNYESLRLLGDAKLTFAMLQEALRKEDLSARERARPGIEQQIAKAKADHKAEAADAIGSNAAPMRIERFMAELETRLADDHILVADASFSSIWMANYISAIKARKFMFPRGLAGLGWGLPMAMGAKVAQPARPVFCLSGDGGFGHVWSELETCKREKINVVSAVINNEILGYQKHGELSRWGAYTNACDLTETNLAAMAEAVGIKGIRVESPDQIAGALDEAFAHDGPVLLDLIVEPGCIPPLPIMGKLHDVI